MPAKSVYIEQLTSKLSELDVRLVMLFGSYAYGTPHKDSDIDLLVVTNDEFMPQTFTEKNKLYISISEHILPILMQVPVDLIVYTLPMFRQFSESGNSFSKEVLTKGIVLYEKRCIAVA
jgi:uncharacterized protein